MKYLFFIVFLFISSLGMAQQSFTKEKPKVPKTQQELTKKAVIAGTVKETQEIVYVETYNSKGISKKRYFIIELDLVKGGMKKKVVYPETVNY